MSPPATYATSDIKRLRTRATKAEMERRHDALFEIARDNQPASVRNIYYRAVVAGLVPKTDSGYSKVQRAMVTLRRRGVVPYSWLTDTVRWRRSPETANSVGDALTRTAQMYRRSLWASSDITLEVWCESDSIAGVIWQVTDQWDVPLLPTRGFSSLTFAYASAMELNNQGRPAVIYYVGDHDPHGLHIEHSLRGYLAEFATVPVSFERLGVTWAQVEQMNLPGSAPKKHYGHPLAVEAEAIPPRLLRQMVADAITQHVDQRALDITLAAEESEKMMLLTLARNVGQGGDVDD